MIEAAVGGIDQDYQHQGTKQGQPRAFEQGCQRLAVALNKPAFFRIMVRPLATTNAPKHRQKHQCHSQGRNQADQHCHGQEFHELPHHPGPEQQRHKHRQGGGGGSNHRPGHAGCGFYPGLLDRLTITQVSIRQFRHHNGAVYQHAGHQDQAEQYDNVEGEAHAPDHQDAGQEGTGNGQAYQQCRAGAHGGDDHDNHQHNGGQYVVEQVREDVPHFLGLIHDVADFQRLRQPRAGVIKQGPNLLDGFDDVGPGALGHLQHQRRLAVNPGKAGGVFEGTLQHGNVAESHHGIAIHLHGHGHHIFNVLDDPGYFQGHAAIAGIQRAGRHQLIVAGNQLRQLVEINAVAFQHLGIHHDFQQVFPVAAYFHFQYIGNGFNGVLQTAGNGDQLPFRQGAGQADGQHRKQGHVDFMHPGLICLLGQLGAGGVHFFAHILQGFIRVETGVKFQHHRGMAFGGGTAHFLDTFERPQLLFHGAH